MDSRSCSLLYGTVVGFGGTLLVVSKVPMLIESGSGSERAVPSSTALHETTTHRTMACMRRDDITTHETRPDKTRRQHHCTTARCGALSSCLVSLLLCRVLCVVSIFRLWVVCVEAFRPRNECTLLRLIAVVVVHFALSSVLLLRSLTMSKQGVKVVIVAVIAAVAVALAVVVVVIVVAVIPRSNGLLSARCHIQFASESRLLPSLLPPS